MLSPKFSIITVTYNAEKVLKDTIESVITQSYRQYEYIIIDGESKDNTLSIIEKYRRNIHILISEPDNGLYDAMNKGLTLATGDYVCFLNAGDCLHSNDTLRDMVRSLSEPTLPDIIYGETAIVNAQRKFLRMRRLSAPRVLTWRSFRQGMLVSHQAFFPKRVLTEPFDLQYRFSSDFDWCIRILKKAEHIHNTYITLIDYLDEGLTTQNRKASLRERFRIMTKHYGWLSTALFHFWFVVRLLTKPGQ